MKSKYFLLVFLLVPYFLFANPFLGKWKMELVGAQNPFILEFIDDGTYSLVEVNVNSPQYLDYTLDEKNLTISLGKVNNEDLDVRYSVNKAQDTFSLFFKEEMVDELFLNSMGLGTSDSDDGKTTTAFTKSFMDKFKKGFKELFGSIPIAVGKRIK